MFKNKVVGKSSRGVTQKEKCVSLKKKKKFLARKNEEVFNLGNV